MCIGVFFGLINVIKNNELIVGICSYYRTSSLKKLRIISSLLICTMGQIWERSSQIRINSKRMLEHSTVAFPAQVEAETDLMNVIFNYSDPN
ncbi:hypothetical protein FAI36_20095 [Enterobacter bugandensis]|nr:hypothetical protein FAI36_20095 [Enterobacter bugandensis]